MNKEEIHELAEMFPEAPGFKFSGSCHDCGAKTAVTIDFRPEGILIDGGAVFHIPETPFKNENFKIKCQECYDRNATFRGWQECEVYSRVVGYLRPVGNWHSAKQSEYNQRRNFDRSLVTNIRGKAP